MRAIAGGLAWSVFATLIATAPACRIVDALQDEGGESGDGGIGGVADARPSGDADPNAPDADPNAPDAAPGPIDAMLPDGDDDGIPDGQDNCPTNGNPDQYDEDGDNVGDVCDNCPHVDNPGQEDGGEVGNGQVADGVGDACDPRPDDGGDSIVFFDGFNGTALDASWQAGPGSGTDTWMVSNGQLVQPSSDVASRSILWHGSTHAVAAADTEVVLDAIAPVGGMNDVSRTMGVLGAFSDTGNVGTGYACFQLIDPAVMNPTNYAVLAEFDGVSFASIDTQTTSWDFDTQTIYQHRLSWSGLADQQECTVSTGALRQTASGTDATFSLGFAGLRTYSVAARFSYFILFDLGT